MKNEFYADNVTYKKRFLYVKFLDKNRVRWGDEIKSWTPAGSNDIAIGKEFLLFSFNNDGSVAEYSKTFKIIIIDKNHYNKATGKC